MLARLIPVYGQRWPDLGSRINSGFVSAACVETPLAADVKDVVVVDVR